LAACKTHFGKRLYPIEDIARMLIAQGLPMGEKATAHSLLAYIEAQLTAEHQVPPAADLVISSRTCIDSFAYARANSEFGLPAAVPEYVTGMLEAVALRESSYYDLHVYFPIEFPAEPDPVRPPGEEYRRAVDNLICAFIQKHSIPHLASKGSKTERTAVLFKTLTSLGMVL
jgi:hypothetical protein